MSRATCGAIPRPGTCSPTDRPLRLAALVGAADVERWRRRLDAAGQGAQRLFELLDPCDVLVALGPLRPRVEQALGTPPQVIASQSWLRHGDPPHSWHQDGALNHRFGSAQAASPLPLRTCWIALTPCGTDAPGLEWIRAALPRLLEPAELADGPLRAHYAPGLFETTVLAPGDALLFDGALLHRTQRIDAPRRRLSIELRFIAAGLPPPALAAETLLPWP